MKVTLEEYLWNQKQPNGDCHSQMSMCKIQHQHPIRLKPRGKNKPETRIYQVSNLTRVLLKILDTRKLFAAIY